MINHKTNPRRNIFISVCYYAFFLMISLSGNVHSQELSADEEKLLNNLSTSRTLQTMRDISRVVVTEESGAGKGSIVSGSKEERILAEYIAQKMSGMGLEVSKQNFPVRSFEYGLVKLMMGATQFEAVTLHSGGGTWGSVDGVDYTIGNGNDGHTLRAPMVDVGDGLVNDYENFGDVNGKIVLVRRGPAPGWPSYSITEAAERGAAAIIFYDYAQVPLPDAIRQDSIWSRDMIPAISISVNSAEKIKALIASGTQEVELENRVDAKFGNSLNVMGTIKGSEFPDEWVLVSGHYDRWFNSDYDNNIGPAFVLELAEVFSKYYKPRRSMVFMAYGSEESGTIDTTYDWLAGSYAFIKDHPEISSRLVYAFNVDGAGMMGEHGMIITTPDNIPYQHSLLESLGLQERLDVVPGPTGNLDSWTMGAIGGGAVSNMFWFAPPGENGETYGSYYHTQFDVHEDSFYANLDNDLRMGTLGLMRASSTDRVPLSLASIADWVNEGLSSDIKNLQDAGLDTDKKFEHVVYALDNFKIRANKAEERYAALNSIEQTERLNQILLKTRRELMPWLYEYGESRSRLRTATATNNLVALHQALGALRSGDIDAATSALEGVGTMDWGMFLSNDAYNTERLMWLEPTGWRSEFEQTPMEVDPVIHSYYVALKKGDNSEEIEKGLMRLEKQANDHLNDALFLVSGKLNAALAGKLSY